MPEQLVKPAAIRIRRAVQQDNAQIRKIVAASLADFGISVEFSGLDVAIGVAGLPDSRNAIELVAELDGEVVGCLALEALSDGQAKLFGFHVSQACRGLGVGRALLTQAVTAARQAGFRVLHLDTWDSMGSAIRLYESMGWCAAENPPPESGANRSYLLQLA
ncbi:GNAT family N-acetyltransferase [Undibacterium sp. Ji49W]|uniref:GNAT family N-acetyltransferase n=1 Tax=Undibacterium sp. Ji49W TaxID=3413040 RepID=UPI003BF10095